MSTCTINYRLRLIEIAKLQGIPCHYYCIEKKKMACMKISYGNESKRDV